MPKRVHQKQKQTVVVNIHSTKTKTRTKRKGKGKGKGVGLKHGDVGRISTAVGYHHQILPPPIYTTPIHNLAPQAFIEGKQLKIPTLAEQQLNKKIDNEPIKKTQSSQTSIDDVLKKNMDLSIPKDERKRLLQEDMQRRGINPRNFSELSDNF